MKVFIAIDEEGWSFHQHAVAMKREWEAADPEAEVNFGTVPSPGADAYIVSFWPLIRRAPALYAESRDRVFIGIRSFWELHSRQMLPAERQLLRSCGGLFAPSKVLAEFAAEWLRTPVKVLHDGVDLERFTPADTPPEEFVVGWAGNADLPEKRFDMAEEACELAGVTFRPVGMGRGLKRLSLEEMPDYYRSLACYLCTSDEEGGPNGPVEAAACGVPVVSTACGAMPEFLPWGSGAFPESAIEVARYIDLDRHRWEQEREQQSRTWVERARPWSWRSKIYSYRKMVAKEHLPLPVFFPDPKPTAVISPVHIKDESMVSITQRLNTPSRRFRWQLGESPVMATVSWTRSKMLTDFMTLTDGDVMLMWDDDMTCPPGDVEALAAKALELDAVVSTLVSKRAFGHGWIPWIKRQPFNFPEDRVLMLRDDEYAGAALNAFPRTVLERMAENLPFVMPHGMPHGMNGVGTFPFFMDCLVHGEDGVKWMTEDRAFCDLARKLGEKVYIYLLPQVTHHGLHGFTAADGATHRGPRKKGDANGRSENEGEAGGGVVDSAGRDQTSNGLCPAASDDAG